MNMKLRIWEITREAREKDHKAQTEEKSCPHSFREKYKDGASAGKQRLWKNQRCNLITSLQLAGELAPCDEFLPFWTANTGLFSFLSENHSTNFFKWPCHASLVKLARASW
jgi:hypothetical protein